MENKEKEIKPIPSKVATNVVTYGDKASNCIVVETVASFLNYYNFINTPRSKTKTWQEDYVDMNGVVQKRDITENIPINYGFNESPVVNLVFSQIIEIVIDGDKKTTKTKEDLAKFLNKYPNEFNKAYDDIINSIKLNFNDGSDKGLQKKK